MDPQLKRKTHLSILGRLRSFFLFFLFILCVVLLLLLALLLLLHFSLLVGVLVLLFRVCGINSGGSFPLKELQLLSIGRDVTLLLVVHKGGQMRLR
jgi:hypothetical protein